MKNRIYKFRAWNKENKTMSPPATLNEICKFAILAGREIGDEVEFMQFTGLLDKNGKEIYEGDCLGGTWEMTYVAWCDIQGGWEIFTREKECMACFGDVHWYEVVDDKEKEAIGNIYETPELLK